MFDCFVIIVHAQKLCGKTGWAVLFLGFGASSGFPVSFGLGDPPPTDTEKLARAGEHAGAPTSPFTTQHALHLAGRFAVTLRMFCIWSADLLLLAAFSPPGPPGPGSQALGPRSRAHSPSPRSLAIRPPTPGARSEVPGSRQI